MKTSKLIGSLSVSLIVAIAGMMACIAFATAEYITVKQAAAIGTAIGVADILFTVLMFLLWVRKNIDS